MLRKVCSNMWSVKGNRIFRERRLLEALVGGVPEAVVELRDAFGHAGVGGGAWRPLRIARGTTKLWAASDSVIFSTGKVGCRAGVGKRGKGTGSGGSCLTSIGWVGAADWRRGRRWRSVPALVIWLRSRPRGRRRLLLVRHNKRQVLKTANPMKAATPSKKAIPEAGFSHFTTASKPLSIVPSLSKLSIARRIANVLT